MIFGKLAGKLARKSKYFLMNNKSEIYLIGGGIMIVAGNVVNCYQSTKLNEVLERHKTNCSLVHEDAEDGIITEKEERASITHQYIRTGLEFAKLYGPGIALNIAGFVLVGKSHSIMRSRNKSLIAAYGTMATAYNEYRKRAIAKYGEEADRYLKYGIETKEGEEIEIDEQGREVSVVKPQSFLDPKEFPMSSPYARVISVSPNNITGEKQSIIYLKNDLIQIQNKWNDVLKRRGWVYWNEVLMDLENPTDPNSVHPCDEGQIVGWLLNGEGDDYIDFGIFTAKNKEFLNGNRDFCVLDFNIQGPIIGKSFRKSS